MNGHEQFDQETALLRRRSTLARWELQRWTVGLAWDRASSTLGVYPVPCVALYVHLPGRRTRTGVARWFRARAVLIAALSVAMVIALGGFFVGRWSSSSSMNLAGASSAAAVRHAREHSQVDLLGVESARPAAEPPVPVIAASTMVPPASAEPRASSSASARRLAAPSPSPGIPYDRQGF